MSAHRYCEFQAVDRPPGRKEQEELRAISTRARITASGFTNHYEWGDLKADPGTLLERYFDLFLYLANWGSRRFAMRLPEGTVEPEELECFALDEDFATVHPAEERRRRTEATAAAIRTRHERKDRLIERLDAAGLGAAAP